MDSPLKGGGGSKGLSTKEKITFFSVFFVAVENQIIFFKTTYTNIDVRVFVYCVLVVLVVFNRFLEIFAYKYGSFSPKIVEKKICKKKEKKKKKSSFVR